MHPLAGRRRRGRLVVHLVPHRPCRPRTSSGPGHSRRSSRPAPAAAVAVRMARRTKERGQVLTKEDEPAQHHLPLSSSHSSSSSIPVAKKEMGRRGVHEGEGRGAENPRPHRPPRKAALSRLRGGLATPVAKGVRVQKGAGRKGGGIAVLAQAASEGGLGERLQDLAHRLLLWGSQVVHLPLLPPKAGGAGLPRTRSRTCVTVRTASSFFV
mmetsp:Transcript_8863/g.23892  ORF Transcript_8863/g.23892 Transcript_8863/m.23892 type:complete len:211 (+) Transcript_8863:819-1451(+)